MGSEFVRRQMLLVRAAEAYAPRVQKCSTSEADVRARRSELVMLASPPVTYRSLRSKLAARQAIGDLPTAANDNEPKPAQPRVRKSSGKFVRGALAETLQALMHFRNTPDHEVEPVSSSWSTDPSTVIVEREFDENGDEIVFSAEDRDLEVRPSVAYIMREVRDGAWVYAKPAGDSKHGKLLSIGKLHFSDGSQRQKVTVRTEAGIVHEVREIPAGQMLGAKEELGGSRGGDGSAVASMSNSRTVALFFGVDESGEPRNWRSFIPKGDTRKGRSYTADESRQLIAEAVANTKVLPPVTKCPPGVACGTARYSDQFVGLVSGSTGKGGAPNWVDVFVAAESRREWIATLKLLEEKHAAVLEAALSARSFAEVGEAAGQGREYARRQGGKRALVAANDNLTAAIKKNAA